MDAVHFTHISIQAVKSYLRLSVLFWTANFLSLSKSIIKHVKDNCPLPRTKHIKASLTAFSVTPETWMRAMPDHRPDHSRLYPGFGSGVRNVLTLRLKVLSLTAAGRPDLETGGLALLPAVRSARRMPRPSCHDEFTKIHHKRRRPACSPHLSQLWFSVCLFHYSFLSAVRRLRKELRRLLNALREH